MNLSLLIITGRKDPRLDWIFQGISDQATARDDIQIVIVDALGRSAQDLLPNRDLALAVKEGVVTSPKPNPWQGAHRLTRRDWWATANARNTALVYAGASYIAFLDDRCHLGPDWMATVREGEAKRASVIAGSYEKHETRDGLNVIARDHRADLYPLGKINCGGGWLYGCTFCMPLAWALEVNGFEEGCDGLTGEDYIFGLMLSHAERRIDYSTKLFVSQDRTGDNKSCKGGYACRDKGASPADKSHAALERFGRKNRTEFTPNLTYLRQARERGELRWPPVDPNARDWYDQELIRDAQEG